MSLALVSPMLASTGPIPSAASAWAVEPKLDGWRVLVYVDDVVDVRTRNGRAIGDCVPELAGLSEALGGRSAILDGELVVGQGQPDDFYRLGPRLAASRGAALRRWQAAAPVNLAVFDLIHLDGADLSGECYQRRRTLLESLALSSPAWCTVPSYRTSPVELLAACARLDLEGVVIKRLDSPYRPGRSRHWVKAKTSAWREQHGPYRHEHTHRS